MNNLLFSYALAQSDIFFFQILLGEIVNCVFGLECLKDLLKLCLEIIAHSCLSLLFFKSSEAPVWMNHAIRFWCLYYPALAVYTHPVALQRDNSHDCALTSTISQIPEYIDFPEFHHSSK